MFLIVELLEIYQRWINLLFPQIAHLEKDLLRLVSPSLEDIKEILDHYHDEAIALDSSIQ